MTCCGVICESARLVAWSDCETYFDRAPGGTMDKLLASPADGGFVVFGAGNAAILRAAHAAGREATGYAAAVARMPSALSGAVLQSDARLATHDTEWWRRTTIIVAGWCWRAQRMTSTAFRSDNKFQGVETGHFAMPHIAPPMGAPELAEIC